MLSRRHLSPFRHLPQSLSASLSDDWTVDDPAAHSSQGSGQAGGQCWGRELHGGLTCPWQHERRGRHGRVSCGRGWWAGREVPSAAVSLGPCGLTCSGPMAAGEGLALHGLWPRPRGCSQASGSWGLWVEPDKRWSTGRGPVLATSCGSALPLGVRSIFFLSPLHCIASQADHVHGQCVLVLMARGPQRLGRGTAGGPKPHEPCPGPPSHPCHSPAPRAPWASA